MKVSKNDTASTTSSTSTQAQQATKTAPSKAKPAPQSPSKQVSDAADRFIQARTGAVGQLLNPLLGDLRGAGEARQKTPDGAMPNPTDATKDGAPGQISAEGTLGAGLQGPKHHSEVDLGIQLDRSLPIERDQLGGGTQVDGRNPNETYKGGVGGPQGNPFSSVGEEAAGKQPIDVQASLDWYKNATQKAAEAGDDAKVEKYAGEVYQLVNNTEKTHGDTPSSPEGEDRNLWDDMRDGVAETASGKKHTGGTTTPTQQMMEQANAEDDRNSGREDTTMGKSTGVEQGNKAKEDSGLEVEGGTKLADIMLQKKETTPPSADDRAPDSEAPDRPGPDHLQDFTDFYHEQKLHGRLGHNIDYGPNDGPGSGDASSADSNREQYVGQYGQDYRKPTEEEIAAAEARMKDATDVGPEVNEL